MAPQSYQLVMRSGPNPDRVYPLDQREVTIGRDSSNTIVINDAEISRKHARLVELPGGGFAVEDLGSTNGTFVNGQRLMGPHTLRAGELILFGENISLVYESIWDADATVIAVPGGLREEPFTPRPASPRSPFDEPREPAGAPFSPAYADQIPSGPAVYEESPRRASSRTWLLAGCGCLILLACLLLAAGAAFDTLNLYCTPPFDVFFACP